MFSNMEAILKKMNILFIANFCLGLYSFNIDILTQFMLNNYCIK